MSRKILVSAETSWRQAIRKADSVFIWVDGLHDGGHLKLSKTSAVRFLEDNLKSGFVVSVCDDGYVFIDKAIKFLDYDGNLIQTVS